MSDLTPNKAPPGVPARVGDEERHWHAVVLLSLDLTLPFHREMGLPPEGRPAQAAAREVITANRAQSPKAPSSVGLAFADALEAQQADVDWVLSWLELGHVRHWGDLWPVHQWRDVLRSTLAAAPQSFPRRRWVVFFGELFDDREVLAWVEALRREPRSDWDVEQCAHEGYTPYEGPGDVFRPILTQMRTTRFLQGLARFHRELGEDEKRELDDFVQRAAAEMGHTLEVASLDELMTGDGPP